jgi:hypothetical protein
MTADTFHRTREAWLTSAVAALSPSFAAIGAPLPPVRVSVGWPGGSSRKRANVIGQCWAPGAASDGVQQIYVSPAIDDSAVVLSTLVHELVHAADNCEHGHRGRFAKVAKQLGLEGPMPATHAGDKLAASLKTLSTKLGAYPHAALVTTAKSSAPKQTTRMIKVECPTSGYVVRTTRKWLDEFGTPLCPCHKHRMIESL